MNVYTRAVWALALNRLSLAFWAGAIAFLLFVAAPSAFAALEPDRTRAGDVVEHMLPRYYPAGAVLGILALASGLTSRPVWPGARPFVVFIGLMILALTCLAMDSTWIYRTVHALREQIPSSGLQPGTGLYRNFFLWHGISMALNAVLLGLVLLASVVSLWPKPRSGQRAASSPTVADQAKVQPTAGLDSREVAR